MIGKSVQSVAQVAVGDALSMIDLVRNADKYEAAIKAYGEAHEQATRRLHEAEEAERRLADAREAAERAERSAVAAQSLTATHDAALTARDRELAQRERDLVAAQHAVDTHLSDQNAMLLEATDRLNKREEAVAASEACLRAAEIEIQAERDQIDTMRAALQAKQAELDTKLEALRNAANSLAG